MKITRFEDLDCWKESTTLATYIYCVTSEGAIAKDYGLRDQMSLFPNNAIIRKEESGGNTW